jgi:hypothetical protein
LLKKLGITNHPGRSCIPFCLPAQVPPDTFSEPIRKGLPAFPRLAHVVDEVAVAMLNGPKVNPTAGSNSMVKDALKVVLGNYNERPMPSQLDFSVSHYAPFFQRKKSINRYSFLQ